MLERKTLSRDEWKFLYGKRITTIKEENTMFNGYVSLMEFVNLKKPMIIPSGIAIAQNGYSWLHIAPKNEYWWLTAMFDDKGKIFECYFDLTTGNKFSDDSQPFFYDAKLDVVIHSNGDAEILDEDELDLALKNNDLSKEEYDIVRLTASRIIDWYNNNSVLMYSYLNNMHKKIREKK